MLTVKTNSGMCKSEWVSNDFNEKSLETNSDLYIPESFSQCERVPAEKVEALLVAASVRTTLKVAHLFCQMHDLEKNVHFAQ